MGNRSFVWGVIVGAGGTWLFHHFIKPVPGAKPGG
jgi:hypothetical protein